MNTTMYKNKIWNNTNDWIGLHIGLVSDVGRNKNNETKCDNSVWKWEDGSPFDYCGGWAEDEPNSSENLVCGRIGSSWSQEKEYTPGDWDDGCAFAAYGACQKSKIFEYFWLILIIVNDKQFFRCHSTNCLKASISKNDACLIKIFYF